MSLLVTTRGFTYGLVAGGQCHDGDERYDKRPEACDAPSAEDDAEVVGVPCEQHLRSFCQTCSRRRRGRRGDAAYVHAAHGVVTVTHVHVAVTHVGMVHVGMVHLRGVEYGMLEV